MTKYELIHQLLDKVELFVEKKHSKIEWESFIFFLNENHQAKNTDIEALSLMSNRLKKNESTLKPIPKIPVDLERVIAQLITFMYRYAKIYSKIALTDSGFTNLDEFTYLSIVFQFNKITKADLIKKSIHEKPTGTEIIKRLLNKGFIVSEPNKDDARSHYVKLTPKGKTFFIEATHKMQKVVKLITSVIDQQEKIQLALILKKLDNFHFEHLPKFKKTNTLK